MNIMVTERQRFLLISNFLNTIKYRHSLMIDACALLRRQQQSTSEADLTAVALTARTAMHQFNRIAELLSAFKQMMSVPADIVDFQEGLPNVEDTARDACERASKEAEIIFGMMKELKSELKGVSDGAK